MRSSGRELRSRGRGMAMRIPPSRPNDLMTSRPDVDLSLEKERGATCQQYAVAAHLTLEFAAAGRELARDERAAGQALGPERGKRAMQRSRHRILGDAIA